MNRAFLLSSLLSVIGVCHADVWQDLDLVYQIDQELRDALPLFYNSFATEGYLNMPSARMS